MNTKELYLIIFTMGTEPTVECSFAWRVDRTDADIIVSSESARRLLGMDCDLPLSCEWIPDEACIVAGIATVKWQIEESGSPEVNQLDELTTTNTSEEL